MSGGRPCARSYRMVVVNSLPCPNAHAPKGTFRKTKKEWTRLNVWQQLGAQCGRRQGERTKRNKAKACLSWDVQELWDNICYILKSQRPDSKCSVFIRAFNCHSNPPKSTISLILKTRKLSIGNPGLQRSQVSYLDNLIPQIGGVVPRSKACHLLPM